jgi:hypothetical protein
MTALPAGAPPQIEEDARLRVAVVTSVDERLPLSAAVLAALRDLRNRWQVVVLHPSCRRPTPVSFPTGLLDPAGFHTAPHSYDLIVVVLDGDPVDAGLLRTAASVPTLVVLAGGVAPEVELPLSLGALAVIDNADRTQLAVDLLAAAEGAITMAPLVDGLRALAGKLGRCGLTTDARARRSVAEAVVGLFDLPGPDPARPIPDGILDLDEEALPR